MSYSAKELINCSVEISKLVFTQPDMRQASRHITMMPYFSADIGRTFTLAKFRVAACYLCKTLEFVWWPAKIAGLLFSAVSMIFFFLLTLYQS